MAVNAVFEARADYANRVTELYRESREELYRYLVATGVRPHHAQEFTQEAFLRLHAAFAEGTAIENPRAWAFAVAHNLAVNSLRRASEHALPGDVDVASTAEGDNPESLLLRTERMQRVHRAFVSLSRQQRLCLSLRAEGFQYKQIAGITGLGVSTVGEFLRRAMVRLKEALRD
jgi:RNA polymerase sigma-70 factor (ECF subfamily)